MEAVKKQNPRNYIIAMIFMLIFVVNDLVFDFLFNFEGSDAISLTFTLAASIIVFVWNGKLKKTKVNGQYEEISEFIKSNFDNWQVIFSILDIICGTISLLSGAAFLACVFKALKFIYIPTKIIVVTNKEKTLIKAISKGSLIWTIGRTINDDNKGEMSKMKKLFKNIKNNPRTLVFGLISAVVFGYATFLGLNQFGLKLWIDCILAAIVGLVGFAGCIIIGWDNVKRAVLFTASKTLSEDKYDQLVSTAEGLMLAQEDEIVTNAELKKENAKADKMKKADEKEALALSKKMEKEEAKKAKKAEALKKKEAAIKAEEEHKAKLLALAEEIKAKKLAEEKARAEDRPQQ